MNLSATGGRLVGEVDKAAQPWYEQVTGTNNPAPIDIKTVVSNSSDEEIQERMETNNSNKVSNRRENESE